MNFEVFDRKSPSRAQSRTQPTVRLASNGRILTFNVAAAHLLDGIDHVVLMFDEDERRLAIAPADSSSPIGYRVNHLPSAANVSCMDFARYYDLEPSVRWDLVAEDGMFIASVGARVTADTKG